MTTNSINKQVSINEVKNAKAVQQVSNVQALRLVAEMKRHLQSAGGLKAVMELTKNFTYSLSETKVNDNDLPVIKVGKKSYYLNPVGQVNETNVLNVIKSVLKVEDAKRVLAKKLAKRLTYSDFCETKEVKEKIEFLISGAELTGFEISGPQVAKMQHRLYNEYLKTLGLDE